MIKLDITFSGKKNIENHKLSTASLPSLVDKNVHPCCDLSSFLKGFSLCGGSPTVRVFAATVAGF